MGNFVRTSPVTIERDELGFDAPAPVGHPARLGLPAGHPTGPEVGQKLPDFELPDAFGRRVRFHKDRDGAKSVVVFYRSAVW
jgi:hypothetical protein